MKQYTGKLITHILRSKNYNWHGVNLQCWSYYYFIPYFINILIDKAPPLVYRWDYSGPYNGGWFQIYYYRRRFDRFWLLNGVLGWGRYSSNIRADQVVVKFIRPRRNFSVRIAYDYDNELSCVYNSSIPTWNRYVLYGYMRNLRGVISSAYGTYGFYIYPNVPDSWKWHSQKTQEFQTLLLNFRYKKVGDLYDIWDNFGNVVYNYQFQEYYVYLEVDLEYVRSYYEGICYKRIWGYVTDVAIFNDVW